ncbi:MAG: hypothetical protein KGM47_17170 [Acidobacteriota bacterium]|nr:hypothetical protein [Acidobacteriota bacterium]
MGNPGISTRDGADKILYQSLEGIGRRLQIVETAVRALRAEFDHALTILQQRTQTEAVASESASAPSPVSAHDVAGDASVWPPSDACDSGSAKDGAYPGKTLKEEALRYARVLVSEIELYYGADVARGRESKDLYQRLKPHIDRSRKAFYHRFGKSAPGEVSPFDDQLVQTLALGDATLLGPGYSPDPPA